MTKDILLTLIKRDIDVLSGDMMLKSGKNFLTYQDFNILSAKLNIAIEKYCGTVIPEIAAASELAKAVIAPDLKTKKTHIKKTIAMSSGIGGISLMVAGIGTALGWGAGIITTVATAIAGVNVVPIFGQITAGALITAIAAYFIFHQETAEEITHKAIESLKQGVTKNIDVIWEKYGDQIQKNMNQD